MTGHRLKGGYLLWQKFKLLLCLTIEAEALNTWARDDLEYSRATLTVVAEELGVQVTSLRSAALLLRRVTPHMRADHNPWEYAETPTWI